MKGYKDIFFNGNNWEVLHNIRSNYYIINVDFVIGNIYIINIFDTIENKDVISYYTHSNNGNILNAALMSIGLRLIRKSSLTTAEKESQKLLYLDKRVAESRK